jgi:hypothetical protein
MLQRFHLYSYMLTILAMSEGRSLSRSYMDPTTDLHLISSDNVVFLIHSFYLKAHRYVPALSRAVSAVIRTPPTSALSFATCSRTRVSRQKRRGSDRQSPFQSTPALETCAYFSTISTRTNLRLRANMRGFCPSFGCATCSAVTSSSSGSHSGCPNTPKPHLPRLEARSGQCGQGRDQTLWSP